MKPAIAIVAFLLFIRPVLPVLDYLANYSYIAKELCENKAKPQLHCNGKCHLKKELARAAAGERPSSKKSFQQETEFLVQESLLVETILIKRVFTEHAFHYSNLYHSTSGCAIFHPPLV